jgi:hypothetical protein
MNPLIADELIRIPRGNLAQKSYRAAYVDARQNALGSHPEIGTDPADADACALRVVRKQFPNFTPSCGRRS